MHTSSQPRFRPKNIELLQRIGRSAYEKGVNTYLVGGSVRDAFLGMTSLDIDLATDADPLNASNALLDSIGGRILAISQFGTVKLEFGEYTIDLAMTRREHYQRPGSLPKVIQSNLIEDSRRRDFSINAMAITLAPPEFGMLTDLENGIADLDRKLIRVLHDRSFQDDATRIFRAIRYSVRLGFHLHAQTLAWLKRDVKYVNTISGARIRQELEHILLEERVGDCLAQCHRLGVLAALHPSLDTPEVGFKIRTLNRSRRDRPDPLATLTYPGNILSAEELIKRLNLRIKQREIIRGTHKLKEKTEILSSINLRPHQVVAQISGIMPEAIRTVAKLSESKVVRNHLTHYLRRWQHIQPLIKGTDLLQLGIQPGPEFGKIIDELRNLRLDGKIRSRKGELAFVHSKISATPFIQYPSKETHT